MHLPEDFTGLSTGVVYHSAAVRYWFPPDGEGKNSGNFWSLFCFSQDGGSLALTGICWPSGNMMQPSGSGLSLA
jgi:hypothetical protein